MEIKELKKEEYAGKRFTVRYVTNGYLDISVAEEGFRMRYVPFEKPVERAFDDAFFGEWLEDPIAFGAFEDGKPTGFVEGSIKSWNNRFRISNICVFDSDNRRSGVGTALIKRIEETAKSLGARMMVLETQSCNENAIVFYRKRGFDIIGFDLYAYFDNDPERLKVNKEQIMREEQQIEKAKSSFSFNSGSTNLACSPPPSLKHTFWAFFIPQKQFLKK